MSQATSTYLKGLNPEQRSAVLHDRGPAMVIAGAGTGKTNVITSRIAYLIEQKKALPEEILALTFTDKAAKEMEERVDQLLPYGYVETHIMTFHSLGNTILQEHGFEIGLPRTLRIVSNLQQNILLRDCLEEMQDLEYFRPHSNPGQFRETLLSYISRLKDEGLTVDKYTEQLAQLEKLDEETYSLEERQKYREIARIYEGYQSMLHARGYVDYGDLLLSVLTLLREKQHIRKMYQNAYKYILVDEFQDTNRVQAEMLNLLAGETQNLMVVGDDDQSIYRFRGAELENMLDFQDVYPRAKLFVLTENYRSTQHIIDVAYELIQQNNPERLEVKTQINKRLHAQRRGKPARVVKFENIHDEMEYIANQILQSIKKGRMAESISILCRNNSHSNELIQYMQHRGIPVASRTSKNLLHEPVIRQCIDFVRVLHDIDDSAALYRYLISEKGGCTTQELIPLSAEAQRNRRTLHEIVIESGLVTAKNVLLALEAYRGFAQDHTIGEVLYKFITDAGYLDGLVAASQEDEQAAIKVQLLAAFFTLVKDFEAVETSRDSYTFWQHIQDMYSTDVLDEAEIMDPDEGIYILTAHRSKGLEFDDVYIFDVTESTFPARRQSEPLKLPSALMAGMAVQARQHEAEERRLMYVAMTRAKSHLTLTYSLDHGGKRQQKASRFLVEAFGKDVTEQGERQSNLPAILTRFGPKMTAGSELPRFPEKDGWLELTPNQVADYLADPSRFFVRHILRFPSPPSHQMIYGVAIHSALEYFYREKQASRQPQLQEMLSEFRAAWRSEGFASVRHERERFAQGQASLERYFTAFFADTTPIQAVENEFRCEIDTIKVRLRGRYDLVIADEEKNGVDIRDFKTSQVANERTARDKVRDTIQLGIYAYAWDKAHEVKTTSISLYFTESGLLASRSKIDHERTLNKIAEVADGIRSGEFPRRGNMTDLETQDLYS